MARVKFGPFEFDRQSGLLWKYDLRIKLQPKSAGVLSALLETPGEVVSRQQIQARLWPAGTFVDFDRSINVAVKRLRDALSDDADEPKYIATVPGAGYRFLATVTEAPRVLTPEPATPAAAAAASESLRRPWLLLCASVAAAVILTLGVGTFFALRRPAIQFHSRDWVLIADFDNRTGEKVLDGTLEYALETELSNSRFVYVVPRERVNDALRLMKRPLDTRLDRATAREVCLRDGAIKAILTGRVEKIGTNYELSVQIIDPARDVAVASYSEEDPADSLLAGTVRKLSSRVRGALGEDVQAIQQSDEQLEKVTTPSLRALQVYTQANRTFFKDNKIAAELLQQALKEDPDFASAHVLLGYALLAQGKQAEAAAHFRRAFELADKTSERERYFILASYYGHAPLNDTERAAEIYETLLRRYPDHRLAVMNLVGLYARLQKPERLDELSANLADLRPNDLGAQLLAAWNLASREVRKADSAPPAGRGTLKPDFGEANRYLSRAIALRNAEPAGQTTASAWLRIAQIHWMEGDFAASHADTLTAARVDTGIDPDLMGVNYTAYGELREAEQRLASEPSPAEQAMLAYYRGDLDAAHDFLRGAHITLDTALAGPAAILMVRTGLTREAETILHDMSANAPLRKDSVLLQRVIEAEIGIAKGNRSAAAANLDKALAESETPSFIANLVAAEDLAQAWRAQGRPADAARVLERAVAGPVWPFNFSAAWQQRLQLQLAELYRESGRAADAQRMEQALAKELAFADSDHPIVRRLAELSKPATAMTAKPTPLPAAR